MENDNEQMWSPRTAYKVEGLDHERFFHASKGHDED